MADSSSNGYHTDPLPASHDWYFYLRQGILPTRALSKPFDAKKSMLPAFRTCSKSHLFRGLSIIHVAIVSPLLFSLPSFSKNGTFCFLQNNHADRDPDFLADPLVARFICAVAPMVLRVDPKAIPTSWSLWFDPKAAAAAVDVRILSIVLLFHC